MHNITDGYMVETACEQGNENDFDSDSKAKIIEKWRKEVQITEDMQVGEETNYEHRRTVTRRKRGRLALVSVSLDDEL